MRKWIIDWNLNTEKKHTLLRLVYEALVDCKKRYETEFSYAQKDKISTWKNFNSILFSDSEPAAKVMVELLGSYTEDNASQARVDAHRYSKALLLPLVPALILLTYTHIHLIFRCIVRALKDPNTFLMDHLLTLKPVRFLEGELIHDVSTDVHGKLVTF